jgi:D-alanyl-D-alanine carboxypeptidase (penicillin-binding protein 5/6)
MKKIFAAVLLITLAMALYCPALAAPPLEESALSIDVPSAVLMEKSSGEVIFTKNAHEKLYPASVTKVMTLLLIVEEIDRGGLSLDGMITGSARAASMGGSQIWLKEGEKLSVSDMLKAVTVVSANDCAVALAEHISGSEETFVRRMNERAAELGCSDTNFKNCTGLFDDAEHVTSAWDVALISRELISHDIIKEYTTIWTDTLRGGEIGLTNTNKLVRFYEGATGLKTGFTRAAGYCLAATAQRDGTEYIAVVMRGSSSAERFESAKTLLNYAFANYALASLRPPEALPPIPVKLGASETVQPVVDGSAGKLVEKSSQSRLEYNLRLAGSVKAPVTQGDSLGTLEVTLGGEPFASLDVVASASVERLGGWDIFKRMASKVFGG